MARGVRGRKADSGELEGSRGSTVDMEEATSFTFVPAGWPGLPTRLRDGGAAASQGFPPIQPWSVESCNLPSAVGGTELNLSFVLAARGGGC